MSGGFNFYVFLDFAPHQYLSLRMKELILVVEQLPRKNGGTERKKATSLSFFF